VARRCFTADDIRKSHENRVYHPLTDEVKSHIRQGLVGKKRSMESRQKQSESMKNRYKENPDLKFKCTQHFKGRKRSLEEREKGGKGRRKYLQENLEAREIFTTLAVGVPKTEEHKRKLSLSHIGLKASKEARRKMSLARRGVSFSPDHKHKLSVANKGKHFIPTNIRKARSKKQWENPEFVSRMMKALHSRPNKCEMQLLDILSSLFPGQYKYNGDFSLGISIDRCIPDFVNVNGKKQVIEFFGEYWHNLPGKGEKDRVERLRAMGWDCLVIWDKELKNLDALTAKLKAFVGGGSDS